MSKKISIEESLTNQILSQTIEKLKESEVFDKETLDKLTHLVNNSELSNEDDITNILKLNLDKVS